VSETPPPERARVFFALWPDPGVQSRLHGNGRELQRRLGGKLTREESVHLTLVFLGDVGLDRLDLLHEIAAAVDFEPFTLEVDSAGFWPHNQIAWLAPRSMPQSLLVLVEALRGGLMAAGFRVETRAYAAHITVVRKAQRRPFDPVVPPVEWPVEEFVLVRSTLDSGGSRYSAIGRWP
jgi:2'-5' RNA ligase